MCECIYVEHISTQMHTYDEENEWIEWETYFMYKNVKQTKTLLILSKSRDEP